MKRLFLFFLASLCLHLLILVPFFLFRNPLPLSGGGDDGVMIEIVGDNGIGEQRVASKFSSQKASVPGLGSGPAGGADPLLAEIRARIERAKRYILDNSN